MARPAAEWKLGTCIECKNAIMSDQSLVQAPEGMLHFVCFVQAQPDPKKPGYFPPFDDLGNRRTIKNAVDCGWSYD